MLDHDVLPELTEVGETHGNVTETATLIFSVSGVLCLPALFASLVV